MYLYFKILQTYIIILGKQNMKAVFFLLLVIVVVCFVIEVLTIKKIGFIMKKKMSLWMSALFSFVHVLLVLYIKNILDFYIEDEKGILQNADPNFLHYENHFNNQI